MKLLRTILVASMLVAAPAAAFADTAKQPVSGPQITSEGRMVPVLKDGTFVGIKVYAIKAGGRFDQPTAKFLNGDTIEKIDGVDVTTDAGSYALRDKVILGTSDAKVTLRRQGQVVELLSKAK